MYFDRNRHDSCRYPADVPRKNEPKTDFGARLVALRTAAGMTQVQLAETIGSSQRMISHYESTPGHPTAPVVAKLAQALDVTTDELLGLKSQRATKAAKQSPEVQRLWKKFQKLLTLPEKDRRAVIRLLNSLATRKVG
jgi:transcriptional regulator with XRE-family HTH domain